MLFTHITVAGNSSLGMHNRSDHGGVYLGQHAPRREGHRRHRLQQDQGGRQDQ